MLKRKRVLFSFLVFFLFAGSLACQGIARAGAWDTEIKKQVNPIQTTRDDKGVWFVTGDEDASLFDVFEAVGYAEATDRLWQAEKFRRTARGTLAELFGPDYLASDIQARTTGYTDQELQDGYDSLNADAKAVLDGYVAGFNRRIKEVTTFTGILPFEFHALGSVLGTEIRPEPWTPQDVLAWVSTMLKFFDGEATGQGQLDNMALYQELGVKFPATFQYMFQDLRWMNDPDAVVYFDGSPAGERRAAAPAASNFAQADALSSIDFVQLAGDLASRQEKIFESLKNINALVKMGSYAWVVSGEKTASGNPILYSGPQMDHAFSFATPSIISEGSINAGGVNISGMTMAGMPVIIIGRTPHHAWSMQVGHAHTLDYYSVTQADIIHQRVETFKVAGMPDVEQTVYRTAYGPVVNADPMISWKYAHWGKEFQTVEAYMEAAMATSMDEFGAAIDKIGLSQHFCYADRDGNFAYWMSGFDPVRAEGADPRFPQLGDGTQDWPEPVQYKPRSTDRNRAEGFYSGWNNKSSSVYTSAPNTSSYYFGPFHRAHVLEDYLSSQDNLTFEDVRDLALNIATTDSVRTDFLGGNINSYGDGGNPWKFVESDFTAAVQANATPERTAALAVMDGWDGHFVAGGPENWAMGMDRADAWILMNAWIREVIRLTFEDELGTGQSTGVLFNVLLHGLPNYPTSITNLYDWFSNPADPDAPQTAEAIIIQALDATLTTLGEQPWGVGKRGMMVYSHEMIGPLHSLPTSSRSTYAQCVEMGAAGPVRVESMLPVGQSGNIMINIFTDPPTPVFDPNFFSMAPVYDPFAHRDFPTP